MYLFFYILLKISSLDSNNNKDKVGDIQSSQKGVEESYSCRINIKIKLNRSRDNNIGVVKKVGINVYTEVKVIIAIITKVKVNYKLIAKVIILNNKNKN